MDGYDASTYGDRIAGVYDELYEDTEDRDAAVAFLWELARGGRALELGVGTGRIALPLRRMGVEVAGIDSSEQMLNRLRAKPGGVDVDVRVGDFAKLALGQTFDLVFVVFNTFFNLISQEDQIACFAAVEKHLTADGLFVIEAFVPDPTMFDKHQRVAADRVEPDRVVMNVMRHSPVEQRIDANYLLIGEDGTHVYPVRARYAYPSELDLMARLAGLTLRDRWGGWHKEPFDSDSRRHISVYERA